MGRNFCTFYNSKHENISKIVEFCFYMPVSNDPTERIFSWMNNLWSFEKIQLSVETLKALL